MTTGTINTAEIPLADLFSIEDFTERHKRILNKTTLKWQLRKKDTNGLAMACVRMGKKFLISESRYQQWLATQAGKVPV